jgi:hypothetical protein
MHLAILISFLPPKIFIKYFFLWILKKINNPFFCFGNEKNYQNLMKHLSNFTFHLWAWLASNTIFIVYPIFIKYMKHIEILIVVIMLVLKVKKTLSTLLIFMNSKLNNHLTRHFELMITMFAQDFYITNW